MIEAHDETRYEFTATLLHTYLPRELRMHMPTVAFMSRLSRNEIVGLSSQIDRQQSFPGEEAVATWTPGGAPHFR
jgi:hypothetical protein